VIGPDFLPGTRIGVLTTQPLDRVLDYRAPETGCSVGDFVEVPLGPRKIIGVVWSDGEGTFDATKLRAAYRTLDVPPMRDEMRAFLERAAAYTITPLEAMLRLATRVSGLGDPPGARKVYALTGDPPARLTDARARVLDAIGDFDGAAVGLSELANAAGVSHGVVKGLVQLGTLIEVEAPRDGPFPRLNPKLPGKELAADQDHAAKVLRHAAHHANYGATLLRGVTGSGKTEVYLEAVASTLSKGRQALVLLPEIALTAEFLTRVEARFGARPAEWHSGVTQAERRRCWGQVAYGNTQLVVGARSALFLPFQDLGLIVVDEEHDSSYKQEDGAHYNARDMAVLRATLCSAQVVLASATPSLESWSNAQSGKYARLDLTSRFGEAQMPSLAAIDMRTEDLASGTWISPTLVGAVRQRIEKGEQSLLFLNRRGYAPLTLCRACGHQIECDECDARMVEHRFQKRLICHQCGASRSMPTECPNCHVEGKLAPVGPGVERLAEEVFHLFPEARTAILSSDLFGSARALKAQIQAIAEGSVDIIIGTQIVAKGHNFPKLTLVGVIDADLGLHGSDLRASERTFQLMRQVAGRAGRIAEVKGEALLQSFQPEHPVLQAILTGEDEAFWEAEAAARKSAGMPPFGRLAGVILTGPDQDMVMKIGQTLARNSGPIAQIGAQVFGPALAPIARIRGQFRVRLLVKAEKTVPLQLALARWVGQVKRPPNVRLTLDIDPQSFY
jgi:primosomal protein N' (replication factor Y) (superfamily II helicase)